MSIQNTHIIKLLKFHFDNTSESRVIAQLARSVSSMIRLNFSTLICDAGNKNTFALRKEKFQASVCFQLQLTDQVFLRFFFFLFFSRIIIFLLILE